MTQLTYNLPNVEFELVSADEAKAIWQKQIDEASVLPWVAWLNQFDLGDTVHLTIKKDTDAESARATKWLINQAAKRHQAGVREPGKPRTLHTNADGTPKMEPVKIKYKTTMHEEDRRGADGMTKRIAVVDRLSICLVASVVDVRDTPPVEAAHGTAQPPAGGETPANDKPHEIPPAPPQARASASRR